MESQSIQVSHHPETKGFDLSAGNTWIYPENYPIRQYQYNIVQSAIYRNTMVCLPTGLGKTFIAAVVMFNFWRWYPSGKIIFLAPTKPLVAQQIKACYEVMGIPNVDMIELTGAVIQKNREIAWLKKRIIFATPQVFHNDLERSIIPSHLIKCIVVDEAHRALGKHSYCECVRILSTQNQYFRILALSATPGNKLDNVHEVIQNLNISHLELRDENSIDIVPYINKRKVDIILVPLSNELAAFKERYIIIMDRHVKFLIQYNVLRGHTANISKGRVFHLLREFKTKTDKSGNYGQIMKTLNILLTMYHAYELMIRHGLRAFRKFYETHSDKFWIHNENQLRDLLHDIEAYLGPFPELYPNGDVSEIPANIVFGHNKFHKLKELLEHHFNSINGDRKDTRAIVFVEYRDIVNEVYILLLQSKPIIRPQMFVGQVSQKQKQQIKALEDFRSNRVNVLISTSIGEEGLDVGEVDLIICFDVSQHSPIRLVQRMGRTGRKRDGHIIVLVTDGKEHENLKSTLSRRDSLNNKILNTSNIFSSLYDNNPRMIPNQFTPECHKMHIIALPKTPNEKGKKGKKNINKKKETFNMKQKENLHKKGNPSQSLMMRFLTDKCNEQNRDMTCNIFTQLTMQNNNTINPNNVKLLTDDNAGIDFLTLYAVKKSEEEMSSEAVSKMDTTYIPAPKPIEDLFSFVVPDGKVINLSFLTEDNLTQCKNYENNSSIQCKNENETIHDNDYTNIDDGNFWCTVRNERSIHNDEIRFEDILDESSDSNETAVSYINQQITDIEINSNKISTSDTKEDKEIITDIRTKLSTNTLEDLEPTIFENILNESFSSVENDLKEEDVFENILNKSFSSIEDDLENKDDTALRNAKSNLSNIFTKNTGEINVSYEANVNTFHNENNIVRTNLSASMKLAKSNKFANFIDEIQDVDFNSDVDMSEFIKCDSNKNKSICNSKGEESFLSITQAIGEIAQVKRNLATSKSSVNKEESINNDSTGWISVNIKNDIKAGKSNPNSRTDNVTLSNTHCNSAAKSHTVKQDFDFLDNSDEDFMITEDSTKQFNELESCYFRNSSKNLKDDIRYMPSTSRNSVIKNGCLDDTSKTLKVKNSYFDNFSKNLKPCGISTPKNDRHSKLSLKRNKAQQDSSTINLSLFKAPDKYVNNTAEKKMFKSNPDTPKRIFPLNEKIAKKSKRRLERENNAKNEFIDDEAEVDSDVSSDEIVTDNEDFRDFVSYTQLSQEQVDMHAHYLQTVKSPINKPGAFHFREPRSPGLNTEIYSQLSSQIQNSYLYDSFCVAEDAEPSILHNNLSLDRMERKLEQNRRKRICFDKNTNHNKKKKINIFNCSVSSEDEIEQLRLQVRED
ncbi:PREDICTED: Fanconi anemia group M protein [Trachymyrmex cornetzi]|uniref:Fanconi anemia group M protein n=1 Tax=Trachymyrmex cornetzi TaxID=471704 RepID=A0A195DFJ2_9HYME|nr:PREDICTED: Fanconi anemia group M protein [Trachymyrmex cornetzi]KYN11617.1 Fanconi anemia group M protein [Trachymyrmex cornetzi]